MNKPKPIEQPKFRILTGGINVFEPRKPRSSNATTTADIAVVGPVRVRWADAVAATTTTS
jgi:hypothetical protein